MAGGAIVLVTRPEPGSGRTVQALRARGIKSAAIPLTIIQPLDVAETAGDFDAVVITSQNAILNGAGLLSSQLYRPVFAVGQSTAKALDEFGFKDIVFALTADELAPLIINSGSKRLLYICGQTRRPELEIELSTANIQVTPIEAYASVRNESAKPQLADFFSKNKNSIVLFQAPSAAEVFHSFMPAHFSPEYIRVLCMSSVIAAHLPEKWHDHCVVSNKPDQAAMLDELDKMLASNPKAKA